ncbi:MAG: L,D-transpeptidase family protein [Pontiellaceae bacterium]
MIKQYLDPIYTKPKLRKNRWFKVFLIFGLIFGLIFYFFIFKNEEEVSKTESLINPVLVKQEINKPSEIPNNTINKETLDKIKLLINNKDFTTALDLINPFIDVNNDQVLELLGIININLLKSYNTLPNKSWYIVQSGDALWKIAKKYNTTIALIKTLNNRKTDTIRVGERLLIFNGININKENSFKVIVSKENNTLDIFLNNQLFKRYSVGTGKFGKTPEVTFIIYDKITEPPWTRPADNLKIEYGDPENVLGTRWMALKALKHPQLKGFGIHGTWDRDSIGSQSSDGCIRMFNEEVEELFDLLPRNTVVIVTK